MKNLFDKTKLKNLDLKNRFIRSAMHEGLAGDNGEITQELINIYESVAKGGVSTIITGFAFALQDENPAYRMIAACNDSYIDGFKKLTDAVHRHGSNIVLQFASGGSQAKFNHRKRTIYAPSAVPHLFTKITPVEMSEEYIKNLVNAYGEAAFRAKKGGFDAIQFHAAHGYLLSQFLTPYYNRRQDKYGGSIENRARIIFEIYEKCRESVGDDFPIFIKINCADFMEDGLTFDESRFVCKKLDEMGINLIEVSGNVGFNPNPPEVIRPKIKKDKESQCYFSQYAKIIADEVNAPVSVVGGNRNIEMMSEILNSSNIEYFSVARGILCESDLISKWEQNPDYDPKCTSCNQCWSLKQGNLCIFNRK